MLDGLRAVAILLVLVHHFGGELAKIFDAGYYGVDLFFIISGYLITSILLKSQGSFRHAYRIFLGRRTLRIFPVYYAALLVMYVVDVGGTRENIFYFATYTWNYAKDQWQGSGLFYLWSLSVEEQFYLFWPLIVLLLRQRPRFLLAVTTLIIMIGYGQHTMNLFPALGPYNYSGLINRMGSLGLGGAGAILMHLKWLPKKSYEGMFPEILAFSFLLWSFFAETRFRFPIMGICSLVLVIKAIENCFQLSPVRTVLANAKMQQLGRISYGVYVFHVPIGMVVGEYLLEPLWLSIPFETLGPLQKLRWHSWLVKLPLYSALSILIASCSFRWFEQPILSLKDVWFPSHNSTATDTSEFDSGVPLSGKDGERHEN